MADQEKKQGAGNKRPEPMVERSKFGVPERRKDPVAEEFRPPVTSTELSKGPAELVEYPGPKVNWRVFIISAVIILAFSIWAIVVPDSAAATDAHRRLLDLHEPGLVLRPDRHPGGALCPLGRVLQGGQRQAGPRPLETAVQPLHLGRDALCRRRGNRHAVLLGNRAHHPIHHPARGGSPVRCGHPGCRRMDHVPLRHCRLGHVRAAGHGHGLLRLPLGHAAVDPRRAVPAAGKARARGGRRRHRHLRAGRHGVRRGNLDGHRRGAAERRVLPALRPARGPGPADRPGAGGGDHDHRGLHLRGGQGHPADLRAEPLVGRGHDALHPRHRPHLLPAHRHGGEHRPLRLHAARTHPADLRLPGGRRRLDGQLDPLLLGVLAGLGARSWGSSWPAFPAAARCASS